MISVEHISRQFGTFKAVDDISFSVQTGEIVGLLGPNGAGKTTTMRMITGFLEPSAGKITIDGAQVGVDTKRKIGYMPESAPLYSDMIVADYLEYVATMDGVDAKERVPHLAEVCGLREVMHKNIGDLSRGNKQRVGLAHALMADPEILILDEPTSGLDPNQVQDVRALIKKIGETRTVIVSTHILSEVETLCSRVIIISGGKKIADSPTDELRAKGASGEEVRLVVGRTSCDEVQEALSSLSGVQSCAVHAEGERVCASVTLTCKAADDSADSKNAGKADSKADNSDSNSDNARARTLGIEDPIDLRPELARMILSRNWDLYEMETRKNSLEDVFRTLTTGGADR